MLALGLPAVFRSIDEGGTFDNRVTILGYVIIRLAMVFLWLRAARDDPARSRACLTYATTITVAQVGFVALIPAELSVGSFFLAAAILIVLELAGPIVAERGKGGTPWHARHIVERYSLLAIIALGEGVIGTVASLSAVVETQGWSRDAALVAVSGTGLTFGMWWV